MLTIQATAPKIKVDDLANALSKHLAGNPVKVPVTNPIGCNIKCEGKDLHWMPPEACCLIWHEDKLVTSTGKDNS